MPSHLLILVKTTIRLNVRRERYSQAAQNMLNVWLGVFEIYNS